MHNRYNGKRVSPPWRCAPMWSTLYLHGVTLGCSLIYLCFNGRTSMSTSFLNSGGVVQSSFPKQTEQHTPEPYQFAEALVGRNVTFSLYQSKADRKVSKSFHNHLRYTWLIWMQRDRAAEYGYTGLQPSDSEWLSLTLRWLLLWLLLSPSQYIPRIKIARRSPWALAASQKHKRETSRHRPMLLWVLLHNHLLLLLSISSPSL